VQAFLDKDSIQDHPAAEDALADSGGGIRAFLESFSPRKPSGQPWLSGSAAHNSCGDALSAQEEQQTPSCSQKLRCECEGDSSGNTGGRLLAAFKHALKCITHVRHERKDCHVSREQTDATHEMLHKLAKSVSDLESQVEKCMTQNDLDIHGIGSCSMALVDDTACSTQTECLRRSSNEVNTEDLTTSRNWSDRIRAMALSLPGTHNSAPFDTGKQTVGGETSALADGITIDPAILEGLTDLSHRIANLEHQRKAHGSFLDDDPAVAEMLSGLARRVADLEKCRVAQRKEPFAALSMNTPVAATLLAPPVVHALDFVQSPSVPPLVAPVFAASRPAIVNLDESSLMPVDTTDTSISSPLAAKQEVLLDRFQSSKWADPSLGAISCEEVEAKVPRAPHCKRGMCVSQSLALDLAAF
jgi:hypothetical protein